MDYLIPWEFQLYPSFSGCAWHSSLTAKIRGSFVDEPRDALKTRMDSFRQWEFQPDPAWYVWNAALTKRIRALFFDASRAALETKMDSLIQWECNHILLGRDMVKRPQWLSTAPGFVESRDALKTKMDFLRQWEFQPDPSLSGYVWNSALTKRIRALFFDASRAALKTKTNFCLFNENCNHTLLGRGTRKTAWPILFTAGMAISILAIFLWMWLKFIVDRENPRVICRWTNVARCIENQNGFF